MIDPRSPPISPSTSNSTGIGLPEDFEGDIDMRKDMGVPDVQSTKNYITLLERQLKSEYTSDQELVNELKALVKVLQRDALSFKRESSKGKVEITRLKKMIKRLVKENDHYFKIIKRNTVEDSTGNKRQRPNLRV
jgi:hypothetical protein